MAVVFQASRNQPLTETSTLTMLAQARRDLDDVAQQRAASLAFGAVYSNMYTLTIGQKGQALFELLADTFRRMSLTRRPLVYKTAVLIIKDCAMYLDHVWLTKREKPSLLELAEAIYARPVARRWRRALAYAKWFVRVRAWRVAFDQEYLKPGNAGALRTAEHFQKCAEHEEWGVSVKRVKV